MERNLKDDIISWIPFVGLIKYEYFNSGVWSVPAVMLHGFWTVAYMTFFLLRIIGVINY